MGQKVSSQEQCSKTRHGWYAQYYFNIHV